MSAKYPQGGSADAHGGLPFGRNRAEYRRDMRPGRDIMEGSFDERRDMLARGNVNKMSELRETLGECSRMGADQAGSRGRLSEIARAESGEQSKAREHQWQPYGQQQHPLSGMRADEIGSSTAILNAVVDELAELRERRGRQAKAPISAYGSDPVGSDSYLAREKGPLAARGMLDGVQEVRMSSQKVPRIPEMESMRVDLEHSHRLHCDGGDRRDGFVKAAPSLRETEQNGLGKKRRWDRMEGGCRDHFRERQSVTLGNSPNHEQELRGAAGSPVVYGHMNKGKSGEEEREERGKISSRSAGSMGTPNVRDVGYSSWREGGSSGSMGSPSRRQRVGRSGSVGPVHSLLPLMMETMQRQLDVLGSKRARHERMKAFHHRKQVDLDLEVNTLMQSYAEVSSDVSFIAGDMQEINDGLNAQACLLAEQHAAAHRRRSGQNNWENNNLEPKYS